MGDVAVRLRRASSRPGPATADGFARLRLRRQAPDIPGRWSRETRTWHMTPRVSPWEERYTLTDGAEIGSGDHLSHTRKEQSGKDWF